MFEPIIGDTFICDRILYTVVQLNIECKNKTSYISCQQCKGRVGLIISISTSIKDRCIWDIEGNLSSYYKLIVTSPSGINILSI